MEYFIFNNHSLPFKQQQDANNALLLFFDVYKEAAKVNFKTVKISSDIDKNWYAIPLFETYYMRDWVENQEIDYQIRIKSLITRTQCPIIDASEVGLQFRADLSDFYYNGEKVHSLGACYLLKQLALSFNSSSHWNKDSFDITHQELTAESENIETSIVTVNNVTTITHWRNHFSSIESQIITNLRKSKERLNNFTALFPYIKLSAEAEKQLEKDRFSPTFFKQIWEAITLLNNYAEESLHKDICLNYTDAKSFTQLEFSDESDTVKQNDKLSRHRFFRYNDKRYFFGYHIKNFTSSNRIHFLIENNEIIIGYIGKHLPL